MLSILIICIARLQSYYLFDKYSMKQDVNPYYLYQSKRWESNRKECYLADGKLCFSKYNKTSKYNSSNDTMTINFAKQLVLPKTLQTISQIEYAKLLKTSYYYTDRSRSKIDQILFFQNSKKELVLDFNTQQAFNYIELNTTIRYEKSTPHINSSFIKIVYLYASNNPLNEFYQNFREIQLQNNFSNNEEPSRQYIYSQAKKGKLKSSIGFILKELYFRFREGQVSGRIQGLIHKQVAFDMECFNFGYQNEWQVLYGEDIMINEITIDPYMEIDHVKIAINNKQIDEFQHLKQYVYNWVTFQSKMNDEQKKDFIHKMKNENQQQIESVLQQIDQMDNLQKVEQGSENQKSNL